MTTFRQLENITVAELVIKYLELEGITHVFGIPGGYISPFLEILQNHPSIKLIIAKHEEGAVFMADGYARLSGKLGVILTTAGPGATNAVTGMACAKIDHIPLMLIVGQPSTAVHGYGAWQDSSYSGINICEIFRHVCSFSEVAMHADNFPSLFTRALRVAHSNPRQTVQISLPINISSATLSKVDFPNDRNYIFPKFYINTDARNHIHEIFAILASSQNPIIFIGAGCIDAFKKLDILSKFCDFVTQRSIPVITSPKAKGLFPEAHEFSLGVFGLGGSLHSSLYLEKYPPDTLIVLGSSLNEWATAQWNVKLKPSKTMIQIDIDPSHIGRVYMVNYGIVLDIEQFLEALFAINKNHPYHFKSSACNALDIALFKTHYSSFVHPEKMKFEGVPLKPQTLFSELSAFSKDKKIVFFLDIGNSTGFFSHYVQLGLTHLLYSAYGFTCMGWSTGASIGAKLAAPDTHCIAIMGDGAFLMNGVEIQTAARYKIGIIYLVMFDDCYGMVNHGMQTISKHFSLKNDDYTLGSPNLLKFAEGLGATAHFVDAPYQLDSILSLATQHAFEYQQPQVIVVKIDPDEQAPFHDRYKAIKKETETCN